MSIDLSRLKHTYSTDGKFRFDNVAPGRYRLVAQSWEGLADIPSKKEDLRKDRPLILRGHGVAEVVAEQHVTADVRALGSASITVETDPHEGNAFLFPTTKKPIGDFVLGTAAWKDFGTQVLGVTHMHRGRMTMKGLPDNSDIFFCYLNYDNAAGVGGGFCNTGRDKTATINVYATWSNGKYDPPARLLPLVRYLETTGISLADAAQLSNSDEFKGAGALKAWKLVIADPTRKIAVGNTGEWIVLDIAAAVSYRLLRRAHATRHANDIRRDLSCSTAQC
jgi:hypothetical protein